MKALLILLSLAFSATEVASQSIAATCKAANLTCHEGVECIRGSSNFALHPKDVNGKALDFLVETDQHGWHCRCPTNRTGLRCNRHYEKCGDTGHFCYHGGRCIPGLEKVLSNHSMMYCNCTGAEHQGETMVGKFCEIKVKKCEGDTDQFCAHGAPCVDNAVNPCQCKAGHRGPHCEFDTGFVPECALLCANDGECTLGMKSYHDATHPAMWALHDGNFQYCTCAEGWYGPTCNVPGKPCGNTTCFHGSTCETILHSNQINDYKCDCKNAHTDNANYTGLFCEHKATTVCHHENPTNGQHFCTNNGSCKTNVLEGCQCKNNYHGPSCEYHPDQTAIKCNLQCRNDGECRAGTKDTEYLKNFGAELNRYSNQTHRYWEHCVCPQGYFGIECEHQLEICPGGQHVCLHGSTCVNSTQGSDQHTCNCDKASTGSQLFAGKFCQYSSTDICTTSGKPGAGKATYAFCVNSGKCKSKVSNSEAHPGCNCPAGFHGAHCEFLGDAPLPTVSPASPSMSKDVEPAKKSGGRKVFTVSAFLLAILVTGLLLRKYFFRSEIEEDTGKEPPASPTPENISPAASDEASDASQVNMQTVEII